MIFVALILYHSSYGISQVIIPDLTKSQCQSIALQIKQRNKLLSIEYFEVICLKKV